MSFALDLVIASRTLAEHGVIDAYGHASVRSDRNPQRYFMARNAAPELVVEADILEYDLDSNPVDAKGRAVYHERFIHGPTSWSPDSKPSTMIATEPSAAPVL